MKVKDEARAASVLDRAKTEMETVCRQGKVWVEREDVWFGLCWVVGGDVMSELKCQRVGERCWTG